MPGRAGKAETEARAGCNECAVGSMDCHRDGGKLGCARQIGAAGHGSGHGGARAVRTAAGNEQCHGSGWSCADSMASDAVADGWLGLLG